MTKRLVSVVTMAALLCCIGGTSIYAKSGSDAKEPLEKSAPPIEKKQPNEKLKADVTKLVADAKAGRLKMPAQHFPQPQRNNLSKGATIAIIAGIGAGIFLIVMFAKLNSD